MKFAKIKNGKVVDIISGLAPDNYIKVIQDWALPTEYPLSFYVTTSKEPIVFVVGEEAHESWGFILKSVDNIKDELYSGQSEARLVKEKTLIPYMGKEFDISTERKRNGLLSLSKTKSKKKKIKVKKNDWIDLNKKQVEDLQELIDDTVQAWFDDEFNNNSEVAALTTYDELKEYVESL